jgi:hypothetical protein
MISADHDTFMYDGNPRHVTISHIILGSSPDHTPEAPKFREGPTELAIFLVDREGGTHTLASLLRCKKIVVFSRLSRPWFL